MRAKLLAIAAIALLLFGVFLLATIQQPMPAARPNQAEQATSSAPWGHDQLRANVVAAPPPRPVRDPAFRPLATQLDVKPAARRITATELQPPDEYAAALHLERVKR